MEMEKLKQCELLVGIDSTYNLNDVEKLFGQQTTSLEKIKKNENLFGKSLKS